MDNQIRSGATANPEDWVAAARGLIKALHGSGGAHMEAQARRAVAAAAATGNGDTFRLADAVLHFARRVAGCVALSKAAMMAAELARASPEPDPEWNIASVLCGEDTSGRIG